MSSWGVAGCELFEESPISNPSSPVDAELATNFWVSPTTGDKFGIALGIDAFRVRSLPGDYLLTYTTWLGTFYIPFRAVETAKLTIALQPGDAVIDVTLQPGTITDISQGTAFEDNTVIALLGPGGGPIVNWQDVFSIDLNLPVVVLVQGGQVVESENVEDLTGGRSDTFGVYLNGGELQLYVPKGDYLVEYTTTYGMFHVVFRAISQRFVTIPLPSGGTVHYVSIQRGMIPHGVEPIHDEKGVTFYFWSGSSPTLVWYDVFIVNVYLRLIILVEEGEIVTTNPFAIVIILPEIDELPGGTDPGSPGEFGNCGNLSIPAGALPPPGECKVWDPYLPAGQQGPPGACSCANAIPGSCLVDHYGNVTACN